MQKTTATVVGLTDAQIEKIKKLYAENYPLPRKRKKWTQQKLAEHFGVTQGRISQIINDDGTAAA